MRLPVLYVEDNAVNVLIMEALFERRPGLRLVVAGTLAEALAEALEQRLRLVPGVAVARPALARWRRQSFAADVAPHPWLRNCAGRGSDG